MDPEGGFLDVRPPPTLTPILRIQLLLATGFGSGWSPKAPGTVGTFAAIFAFYPMRSLAQFHPVLWGICLLGFLMIAVWAADGAEKGWFRRHDVGNIVVDEFLGYFVTMTLVPVSFATLAAGFVIFRALDILKPQPAKHIDRTWPGGWGVVMDDVVAGVYANVLLQLFARVLLPRL